ncbi:MAG: TIR domain-containing protein, partial [Anaerolineae bacterium]|nr:TIR domain-containing protein [Anaerolineae bacterium]
FMADQPPIFISYGRDNETADFVPRLHDDLEASGFKAWLDTHDIKPSEDWDLSIQAGLDSCRALVLVVTRKSLNSPVVKAEWNRVLSAGKPVVPLMWGKDVTFEDLPFRLQLRQGIDFKEAYSQAKAKLFQFLRDLPANPTPVELSRARLEELQKAQAASDTPERFEQDIQEVQKRIAYEEDRAQNPDAVEQREQASLKASLERIQQQQSREAEERQQRRFSRVVGHAPQNVQAKFKDRTAERASLRSWFADTHTPLMVVVGHGGMGKTALTCYVMDELEGDSEKVAGLIYLSTVMGGVNLEKVFLSVGQMTGQQKAMTDAYNDANTPLAGRIQKLLDVLEREDGKRYILLLDNFETLQNTDDGALTDTDLHEFLTLMMQQAHPLKILITTRIPLKIPAQVRTRVKTLPLEAGLPTDEAVQFLQDLGVTGDKNKLHELARRLHGYPRALEAAAA